MKLPCENLGFLFGFFAFPKQADFLLCSQHPCWRSDGAKRFLFLILLHCYQLSSLKKKRREEVEGKGKEKWKENRKVKRI